MLQVILCLMCACSKPSHGTQCSQQTSLPLACMHCIGVWLEEGLLPIGVLYSACKRTLQARFTCGYLQCLQLLHHQTNTPFITDVLPVLVLSLLKPWVPFIALEHTALCLPTNRHLTFSFACRCCAAGYYDNIMRYVIEQ